MSNTRDSYFNSGDIRLLASSQKQPTFFLDINIIRQQIDRFRQLLPQTQVYYSTKTNPHPAIIETAVAAELGFDVATIGEIEHVLQHGADPALLLFTLPVKSVDEIHKAWALGVRNFTLDSLQELQRHQQHIKDAKHYLRLAPRSNASLYDYKNKFGADASEAAAILDYAVKHNLPIGGLSFMVGSQTVSLKPWQDMFDYISQLLKTYYNQLPSLRTINIGSGFPLPYGFKDVPSIESITEVINKFSASLPPDVQLIAETGRFIAGPSTVMTTRVVQKLRRGDQDWLYTDANCYSGLIEMIESGGKFAYPISSYKGGSKTSYNVAGKTLDPDDIIGRDVLLSKAITSDDILTVHDVGAYTGTFFTDYHHLPRPLVVLCDSEYADNVCLGNSNMQITGVQTKRAISAGEVVYVVSGYGCAARTRTSFQVGHAQHIEPNLFGAYLNHSCNPNVGVRTKTGAPGQLEIVARRDIKKGEDIVADYAMFEYETSSMAAVECLCGADVCRRFITGYKDLLASTRASYAGLIAEHLQATD